MNLYEITNKFVELNNNDELTQEEYEAMGKELALELKNKSSNIIGYIQNNDVIIEGLKKEEERLKGIRRALETKQERFKFYVKQNMERLNLNKIDTDLGTISIRKNPISVEIVNEDLIPSKYKKIKQEIVVDKKAIADNFKENGEIVEGVKIIDNKTSLNIK